ncbi:hypothetical protein BD413DRAFT_310292 [Trametes elegans]|nr:hypothetical protein BD413DRAFT_310292 [Trametes elegans]
MGLGEVKTEPAEETIMKGVKKGGRQSTGRSGVKSRGKGAVTTVKVEPTGVDLSEPAAAKKKGKAVKSRGQIEPVAVKVETIGGDVLEETATDGVPPAKKRRTTKRGPAKQTKMEGAAAVKVESEASNKRTRKKNAMPSEAGPTAQNPKPKRTPRKKCVKTVSQQVTGQAAVTTDAPATSLTITASMLSLCVSFSRTSSLRRRESYKGSKHPPRTVAYAPEEMAALENVRWDVTGFECMELSALPWIAGVAQQWCAQGGVEVAGGEALERGE